MGSVTPSDMVQYERGGGSSDLPPGTLATGSHAYKEALGRGIISVRALVHLPNSYRT